MRKLVLLIISSVFSVGLLAQDAAPVQVVQPKQQALAQQLVLSGSLTAQQDAALSSRTAGLVASLLVDAGAEVSAGQPLLKLDSTLAQHELAQQQAAFNAALVREVEAERLVTEAEQLSTRQLLPQTELTLRRAALAQAQADTVRAKAALAQQQEVVARHTLTAPFAGVIARRFTDVGEWVDLGTPVLQLVSLNPLLLDLQVPQEYFSQLNSQRRVEVVPDLQSSQRLVATLSAAVPVGDASARSFLARFSVNSPQQVLLPGSSASATLYFERDDSTVLVVPPDALLRHPDGNYSLFSIKDNKAQRHLVQLGKTSEQGVEILSGLPAGQPVVVRGNETLRDGQSVSIVNSTSKE
ncbi:efflux RND transporter periplasmic adaptor subunit [Rheinheimera fenheensis]|uniref:efflux RND transporter periplasmic adaptor subunit n=1 Tax=Rheinheimera fenheensis TaxID=3152295 RepID=UPI00325FE150